MTEPNFQNHALPSFVSLPLVDGGYILVNPTLVTLIGPANNYPEARCRMLVVGQTPTDWSLIAISQEEVATRLKISAAGLDRYSLLELQAEIDRRRSTHADAWAPETGASP